jgi:hypothetical protein
MKFFYHQSTFVKYKKKYYQFISFLSYEKKIREKKKLKKS